jgi:hypothetical protein
MKYRIIERYDGRFDCFKKNHMFDFWHDVGISFLTLEEAKNYVKNELIALKKDKERINGRKHKRIVLEINNEI